jgi:2-polyprenyl-3-methyl-5-hydroxy-6-metoxy-1,4-benzoquinol methylase
MKARSFGLRASKPALPERLVRLLAGRGWFVPAAVWDDQYRRGRWGFLRGTPEHARYAAIADLVRRLKPGGAILDVGCGEGLLLDWLKPGECSRYTGIDISAEAVARASARQDARAAFVCADTERYVPGGRFEVIVYNEVLYYLGDPMRVLQRHEQHLAPGGLFVASVYSLRGAPTIYARILRRYDLVAASRTTCGWLRWWDIRAFQPRPRTSPGILQ